MGVHRSKTEAPRAAGTLIPYLLSGATAERLLKIGFEATDPFVGGNTFAVLSRVFWTKLPSGRRARGLTDRREIGSGRRGQRAADRRRR